MCPGRWKVPMASKVPKWNSVPNLLWTGTRSYEKIKSPSSSELLSFQLAVYRLHRSRAIICSRNSERYLRQKLSERHKMTNFLFPTYCKDWSSYTRVGDNLCLAIIKVCSWSISQCWSLISAGTLVLDSRSKHNRPRRTTAQTRAKHSQRHCDRLANSMSDAHRNADPVML